MSQTRKGVVLLIAALVAVTVVPTSSQAVSADCTSDFSIVQNEPLLPDSLSGSSSVTGSVSINMGESKTVFVQLASVDDELQFGVFIEDGTACEPADENVSITCSDHEVLSTTSAFPPQEKDCALAAPSSGSRTYYFHLVNPESDALDYKIWWE